MSDVASGYRGKTAALAGILVYAAVSDKEREMAAGCTRS